MVCWLRKAALFIGTTMAPATLSVLSNGKCDDSHTLSVRSLLGFAFGAADAFARIASNFAGRWLQSS
jgi:hypothetical protein